MLAVVIPVLNEAQRIEALLWQVCSQAQEVWVIDGGSTDDTWELASRFPVNLVHGPRGRARQMNLGAQLSHAPVLVFIHADTLLPAQWAQDVCAAALHKGWGRFSVAMDFDVTGLLGGAQQGALSLVAHLMNWRSRLTGISTGDQVQFVRRDWFERVGGFPNQVLMEDIALSQRLKRLGSPANLGARVGIDPRRWISGGIWATIVLMWSIRWAYWWGVSPARLKQRYQDARR
jgi:rSAM/selenodomain-associated transferase 2